jgi:hypothetical protein
MKKLLGIMVITALAASAFAQGTISASNGTGLVNQWSSTANSTIIKVPKNSGIVEIFAAPTSAAAATALFSATAGGVKMNYSSLAGWLADNTGWEAVTGGQGTLPSLAGQFSLGTLTINNIARGANAQYLIIGWTGNAASLDAAIVAHAFAGMSPQFTIATGDPLATPLPGQATALKTSFTGMVLAPVIVPEPASFALAGLGLATLLVFRRRK